MNIKNSVTLALTSVIAVIVTNFNPPAHAQGSIPITQSQASAGLNSSPWTFRWDIDSSITFTTNGAQSYGTGAALEYGTPSAVWNIAILFGNGNATVTATTGYLSPAFNWSMTTPIGSLNPITSLTLGNTYSANNNESVTISGITINGGIPIAGTLTANASQPFSGLTITDSTQMTAVNYTLTASTTSTWQLANGANPALSSLVMIPSSVPEPTTLALLGVALLALTASKRKK